MDKTKLPIGFIDSGIGDLIFLKRIKNILKNVWK